MTSKRVTVLWTTIFLLEIAACVWTWSIYLQALGDFGMLDHVPTHAEIVAHLKTIWVTPWAIGSTLLLGVTFILFCQLASVTGRWWGWPLQFLGELLFIVFVWWAYRLELLLLENISFEWAMMHLKESGAVLPYILAWSVIFLFLSMIWYGIVLLFRWRARLAYHARVRQAALAPRDCPSCQAEKTLARCTEGFAAGKVMRCSACDYTQTLDVEDEDSRD